MIRICLRLIVIAGTCLALPAAAQAPAAPTPDAPAAAPTQAERFKAEGDVAMQRLAYEQALQLYAKAYALEPSATLSYNKGRALQALTRYPEALDELEAFAREASPELKARVPKLDELLRDVRAMVSTLRLSCNVAGAHVVLERRVVGTTPLQELRVNAGRATLEVTREGYHSYRKQLDLPGNAVRSVNVELFSKNQTGVLEVTSPVAGATVFINDKQVGTVPAQAMLPPGEHRITLRHEGYEEARTIGVVRVGQTAKLDVALATPPGLLSQWWFWTGVGVVVVGGTALTVALLTERSPDEGDIAPGKVSGPLLRF